MKGVFLPDEESIRELFGPWLDKGLKVFTQFDELRGCWCIKVQFRYPSNAMPVWQLNEDRLTTAEDAKAYFIELRDTRMAQFCGPLHPVIPPIDLPNQSITPQASAT